MEREVAHLRESYSSHHRSWPDRRNDPATFGLASWCHGTAGIGTALLRLQRQERWSSDAVARMLDGAVATTAEAETRRLALCCGLAGRVALLLDAGEGRGDAVASARGAELASALAARYLERVGRASDQKMAAALPAGLMQGASGIGLTLLRAGAPFPTALPQVTALAAISD